MQTLISNDQESPAPDSGDRLLEDTFLSGERCYLPIVRGLTTYVVLRADCPCQGQPGVQGRITEKRHPKTSFRLLKCKSGPEIKPRETNGERREPRAWDFTYALDLRLGRWVVSREGSENKWKVDSIDRSIGLEKRLWMGGQGGRQAGNVNKSEDDSWSRRCARK